jgi:hypothetical protein
MIARYITQHEVEDYMRCGWQCSFHAIRGDNVICFVATFKCCEAR